MAKLTDNSTFAEFLEQAQQHYMIDRLIYVLTFKEYAGYNSKSDIAPLQKLLGKDVTITGKYATGTTEASSTVTFRISFLTAKYVCEKIDIIADYILKQFGCASLTSKSTIATVQTNCNCYFDDDGIYIRGIVI